MNALGIVVPVRNGAATIARALQSIAGELATLPTLSIDIVVVDGSSTDGSADIAQDLRGARVLHQTGVGLAQARNQGIGDVRGDLIAFLDADDRWAAGSLGARVRALTIDADALGVIGHMVTEPVPGATVDERQAARLGVPVPAYTPGALVARRHAFEAVGPFDETLAVAADSEWFVRARADGHRIALIDDLVLHKGARDDSLSTDVERYRRELLDVSRRFLARRNRRS